MAPPVPSFYRIWFTTIDPIISLSGVYLNIFNPTTILSSYSPTYAPPRSETILLLDTVAAFLAGLIFLQIVLLRAKATDMVVWRAVQTGQLIVDLGMLAAYTRALRVQGRMSLGNWRAEEWGNYTIVVGVEIIRLMFLTVVGMGRKK